MRHESVRLTHELRWKVFVCVFACVCACVWVLVCMCVCVSVCVCVCERGGLQASVSKHYPVNYE